MIPVGQSIKNFENEINLGRRTQPQRAIKNVHKFHVTGRRLLRQTRDRIATPRAYANVEAMEKIGRYMATTINPIPTPKTTMSTGSNTVVNAATSRSTSRS